MNFWDFSPFQPYSSSDVYRHIVSRNGILYEEPLFLLKDEVKDPVNYISILRHGKQGLAVGQARILVALPQQPAVLSQGGGAGLGGGFKGQNQHNASAPSTVIFRQSSPSFSMVTVMAPSRASADAFCESVCKFLCECN